MYGLLVITISALAAEPPANLLAMRPEQFLLNMPVNSDHRCVGISLVTAALLEGDLVADDRADDPSELGGRIYEAAFNKGRVRFHSKLKVDGGEAPIQSRQALESLATAVADRYKQRHLELIETAEGRNKLWMAERAVLRNVSELDALLAADVDHVVPVMVTGSRRFPDGSVKDTNHAVLFAKQASGETVVYDPNDPGQPITCRFTKTNDGLTAAWTCRYPDTGQITSQQYYLIETDKFFRGALSR